MCPEPPDPHPNAHTHTQPPTSPPPAGFNPGSAAAIMSTSVPNFSKVVAAVAINTTVGAASGCIATLFIAMAYQYFTLGEQPQPPRTVPTALAAACCPARLPGSPACCALRKRWRSASPAARVPCVTPPPPCRRGCVGPDHRGQRRAGGPGGHHRPLRICADLGGLHHRRHWRLCLLCGLQGQPLPAQGGQGQGAGAAHGGSVHALLACLSAPLCWHSPA